MIGNALEFTEKGEFRIEISKIQIDDKPFTKVETINTGIGICEENFQ